jgi:hypothetical protein
MVVHGTPARVTIGVGTIYIVILVAVSAPHWGRALADVMLPCFVDVIDKKIATTSC